MLDTTLNRDARELLAARLRDIRPLAAADLAAIPLRDQKKRFRAAAKQFVGSPTDTHFASLIEEAINLRHRRLLPASPSRVSASDRIDDDRALMTTILILRTMIGGLRVMAAEDLLITSRQDLRAFFKSVMRSFSRRATDEDLALLIEASINFQQRHLISGRTRPAHPRPLITRGFVSSHIQPEPSCARETNQPESARSASTGSPSYPPARSRPTAGIAPGTTPPLDEHAAQALALEIFTRRPKPSRGS